MTKPQITICKWLILIALLAYTAYMAVWAGEAYDRRLCTGIEVCVDSRPFMGDSITQKGVVEELARFDSKLIGKNLSKINTETIETYLSKFNNFENVECIITSGGKLRVSVVPMIPELRVFETDGDSYYINKDGKRIDANAKFFIDVPIVYGNFNKSFTPSMLLPVTRFVSNDPVMKDLVMMIKADSPNNILLIPRISGHVINIGNSDNLAEKCRNIKLVYRDIMPYKGWETYDTISVKFAGRIVATRRNKAIINHVPEYEENIDYDENADNVSDSEFVASTAVRRAAGNDLPRNLRTPRNAADSAAAKPAAKKPQKQPQKQPQNPPTG